MNEQTPETEEVSLDRYILEPNDEIVDALINHWSWIFEDDISIVMMSRLGDFFLEDDNGIIYWLNTGTGELDRIAANDAEFQQLLQTESFDDWFLTDLVDECHAAGLVPGMAKSCLTKSFQSLKKVSTRSKTCTLFRPKHTSNIPGLPCLSS